MICLWSFGLLAQDFFLTFFLCSSSSHFKCQQTSTCVIGFFPLLLFSPVSENVTNDFYISGRLHEKNISQDWVTITGQSSPCRSWAQPHIFRAGGHCYPQLWNGMIFSWAGLIASASTGPPPKGRSASSLLGSFLMPKPGRASLSLGVRLNIVVCDPATDPSERRCLGTGLVQLDIEDLYI